MKHKLLAVGSEFTVNETTICIKQDIFNEVSLYETRFHIKRGLDWLTDECCDLYFPESDCRVFTNLVFMTNTIEQKD